MLDTEATIKFIEERERAGGKRESLDWDQLTALEQELNRLTPDKNYGLISGAARLPDFLQDLTKALEAGNADDYLRGKPLNEIYVLHAETDQLTDSQQEKKANHQKNKLAEIINQAKQILERLKEVDLPQLLKQEYEKKINKIIDAAETLKHVGRSEFTREMILRSYPQVLDFSNQKQLATRYAQQAKEELEIAREGGAPIWFSNLGELLDKFRFKPDELTAVELHNIDHTLTELNFFQAKKLIQAWLNRSPQFKDWQIIGVDSSSASVRAKSKEVKLPKNTTFSIDRLGVLLAHEGFHVLRAGNGELQRFIFARLGCAEYLADEEGGASFMELLLGEPRGHQRQLVLAARNYAIHLAMQTETDEHGQLHAQYSIQQIYNTLCQYGLDKIDPNMNVAAWIVERIFRGTSYQRELVTINVPGRKSYQVPEVVHKDAVYY
ncbi:MAG: DUF1704 domain-containing protein, partial [Candidatus Pacebacteria bacterium]|nr:DUF1704 domain-containing protein [Candidatus Paceibacterota bacterium]